MIPDGQAVHDPCSLEDGVFPLEGAEMFSKGLYTNKNA